MGRAAAQGRAGGSHLRAAQPRSALHGRGRREALGLGGLAGAGKAVRGPAGLGRGQFRREVLAHWGRHKPPGRPRGRGRGADQAAGTLG
eukprot:5948-Pleurochrysis_carterae.AAC.1